MVGSKLIYFYFVQHSAVYRNRISFHWVSNSDLVDEC